MKHKMVNELQKFISHQLKIKALDSRLMIEKLILQIFFDRKLSYLLMTTSSQGHLAEEVLVVEEVTLGLRAMEEALMGPVFRQCQVVTWDMRTLHHHM